MNAPGMASAAAANEGWPAWLDLVFRRLCGRTVPVRRESRGPLRIQRPFYPEGEVCHLYLLHPPGGIVGGDRLTITARVEAEARALLTTPAAGKFYRSGGRLAAQHQHLHVADGGALEWLPQETIVFDGADARSVTRVELEEGARFIGWEMLCLGRPAAGERYDGGVFDQAVQVFRAGRPLLLERNLYEGGGEILRAPWGLDDHPLTASLICTPCDTSDLAAARAAMMPAAGDERIAVTLVDGLLVARFIGRRMERARDHFIRLWETLRPRCLGIDACQPRIWNT
jgi:urease accessory protein